MLPYVVPLRHAQSWWLLSKAGINFNGFLSRISEATGLLIDVWVVLILFAVLFGIGRVCIQTASDDPPEQTDLLWFDSLSLVLGLAGFGFLIHLSGLPTEPWYYIPALVFAAVCCDAILPRIHPLARVLRFGHRGCLCRLCVGVSPTGPANAAITFGSAANSRLRLTKQEARARLKEFKRLLLAI